MSIKEANERFEQWRKEQISSLIRTGHLEAAKAFEQLGSIHWMAWQPAWSLSRESLVIELPTITGYEYDPLADADYRARCREAIEAAGLKVKS